MMLRAIDLAQNELSANSEVEDALYKRLDQLTISGNATQNRFKDLSTGMGAGNFDASDEIYAFLQLNTVYKLKETDPV